MTGPLLLGEAPPTPGRPPLSGTAGTMLATAAGVDLTGPEAHAWLTARYRLANLTDGVPLAPVTVLLGWTVAKAHGLHHGVDLTRPGAWVTTDAGQVAVIPHPAYLAAATAETRFLAGRVLREALDLQAQLDQARARLLESRPLRLALHRGDRDAMLRALEPAVIGATRGMRAPGLEHEDLLQHARIGVLAAIDSYRPDRGQGRADFDRAQHLSGWCALIARRHVVSAVRAATAERQLPRAVSYDDLVSDGPEHATWGRDRTPDVLDMVVTRDELRSLRPHLAALPDRERRAILLTAMEGLSQAEAAQVEGVAVKTINVAVWRARRALRASREAESAAAA